MDSLTLTLSAIWSLMSHIIFLNLIKALSKTSFSPLFLVLLSEYYLKHRNIEVHSLKLSHETSENLNFLYMKFCSWLTWHILHFKGLCVPLLLQNLGSKSSQHKVQWNNSRLKVHMEDWGVPRPFQRQWYQLCTYCSELGSQVL